MGYRSDVAIAVAFKTREQMEDILAIYRMNPDVQKHNVMAEWKLCPDKSPPYMVYVGYNVKWYSEYEDVKAFEYIASVCSDFYVERRFEFAYRLVRIGEEDTDIVVDDTCENEAYDLVDFIQTCVYPRRSINCSL